VPVIEDEALVLDHHPFGDRHLVLTVLTHRSGVQRGVLRRARGGKAPTAAAAQIMSLVHVGMFQKPEAELATYRHLDLVTSSFPLTRELGRSAAAAVVAELLIGGGGSRRRAPDHLLPAGRTVGARFPARRFVPRGASRGNPGRLRRRLCGVLDPRPRRGPAPGDDNRGDAWQGWRRCSRFVPEQNGSGGPGDCHTDRFEVARRTGPQRGRKASPRIELLPANSLARWRTRWIDPLTEIVRSEFNA
jgi:hypothetical protein